MREDAAFRDGILSDFSFWDVDAVDGSTVTLAGQIQCRDSTRWPVQREFNRRILNEFTAKGIEITNPQRNFVIVGGNGNGQSAPYRHLEGVQHELLGYWYACTHPDLSLPSGLNPEMEGCSMLGKGLLPESYLRELVRIRRVWSKLNCLKSSSCGLCFRRQRKITETLDSWWVVLNVFPPTQTSPISTSPVRRIRNKRTT